MGQGGGRIESLDALRGFALLGILVVNIQMFSGWGFIGPEGREALSWSHYDRQIHAALKIVAHDKFYSLFSLLFGYGFVMLAGKKGARYHLRRMVGLIVIGLAHAIFIWPWDILLLYGLVGVVLTPFLNRSAETLCLWGLGLLLAIGLGRWYWLTYEPAVVWRSHVTEVLGASVPKMANASYPEIVRTNAQLLVSISLERIEGFRPVRVMAMLLFGAAAARLQLAQPDASQRRRLRIFALLGLPLAMVLAAAQRILEPAGWQERIAYLVTETLAAPITAMVYAAILTLWWTRDTKPATTVRAAFAPAGRMALTNYLAQSAFFVPIFYGFGLGLFAELSLAKLMVLTLGVFLAQLIISRLWLGLFRQGPMEWLWRWQIQGSRPSFLK